jgi:CubicO group peptidase (beta-lactamase class C family)
MRKLLASYFFFLYAHCICGQILFAREEVNASMINAMETAIQDGVYPNIHSILIAHNSKLIYENYWAGADKKNGKDVGVIPHGINNLHGIQSISKSIVSACVGIALGQGKIKSIDQKIFEFFPEYIAHGTGVKAEITIKDLLTMTSGLQWNEDNYNDPANNEHQMYIDHDPVGYVLRQPLAKAPGKTFNYNGGATLVLAAILQKATGKSIDAFAKEYLFTPLDISNFEWTTCDNSDVVDAFSGLYLKSRDLLKFGLLYMNDGKWNAKQIIPERWMMTGQMFCLAKVNMVFNGGC